MHQAGVATPAPAQAVFVGLDLRAGVDRDGVRRLLRLLSDDAARLTQGRPALGDTEPELAATPARLTVTFGFGPGLFDRIGRPQQRPASVAVLPRFGTEALQPRWSGGDLLLQVCSDDPVTVAHTIRMLSKDAREFAAVRWVQRGFRPARGTSPADTTMRNLMGQLDGTVNPIPGSAEFDAAVWAPGPGWFTGGTVLVLRRGYNYDEGPAPDGIAAGGLLFAAYQADASTAFVPVQRRLAATDALNRWVEHIGSAVFALPPGCPEGKYIGQELLDG
jgi:dye decolorizing peroxidase